MSDKVKIRKSTAEKLLPDLVKSLEHLAGSNEYWRYYDYEASDSDSDTRSSYSIASLTFQRDRRGILFPDIVDKHSSSCKTDSTYKLGESLALPDISSCVVMTSRRRKKKNKKKPRKTSGRYFPEISTSGRYSTDAVQKEKEEMEVARSMSSAEEYSPKVQRKTPRKKISPKHRQSYKDHIKLPNI